MIAIYTDLYDGQAIHVIDDFRQINLNFINL